MNSFSLLAFLGRFPNAVLGALLCSISPAMASLGSSSPTGTTICCLLCTKTSLVQVFLLDYSLYMQFTFSLLVPPAEFPSSHLPVTAASLSLPLLHASKPVSKDTKVMLAFLIHPLTVTFFPSSWGGKKKVAQLRCLAFSGSCSCICTSWSSEKVWPLSCAACAFQKESCVHQLQG